MRRDYGTLLKDPRWQKTRLRIMNRDGWHCQRCSDKDSTLNVHHIRYATSGNPWDAPDSDLTTLCETCHREITELLRECKFRLTKLGIVQLQRALGYIQALDVTSTERIDVLHLAQKAGIADHWGIKRDDVEDSVVMTQLWEKVFTAELAGWKDRNQA